MIVLDTNIVSVLMADVRHPDDRIVEEWLDRCSEQAIWVTAIARAEVAAGIAVLPEGRRKETLARAAAQFFDSMAERILPFGSAATEAYGQVIAVRQLQGRSIAVLDAQIAAVARCARATLATRNDKDFAGLGLRVVNPYRPETWA